MGTDRLVHLFNPSQVGRDLHPRIDRSTPPRGRQRIDVEHYSLRQRKEEAAISYLLRYDTTTMKRASTAAATTLLLGLLGACLLAGSATATWILHGHDDVEVIPSVVMDTARSSQLL